MNGHDSDFFHDSLIIIQRIITFSGLLFPFKMILIQPEKCKIHINMYRSRNLGSILGTKYLRLVRQRIETHWGKLVDTGVKIEPPVAA